MGVQDTILVLVKEKGIVRPRDIDQFGLAPSNLNYMASNGLPTRLGRGL